MRLFWIALCLVPVTAAAAPPPSGPGACAPASAEGFTPPTAAAAARMYRWARRDGGYEPLSCRVPAPSGFQRVQGRKGSYAHWLRHLPLLPAGTPVRSYQGQVILAADSAALAAVMDLDVGKRDRQQCADTIMRLRGEYLFTRGKAARTSFRWAGGKRFGFSQWRQGIRPVKQARRRWSFEKKARPSGGYGSFRRYLGFMFSWTGTLHQMGEPRVAPNKIEPGDFLIQGGSPGHAVIILDLARNDRGQLRALIGQGFMPAQDLHLLRGPGGDPWFELVPKQPIRTPLWKAFSWKDLRRFRY